MTDDEQAKDLFCAILLAEYEFSREKMESVRALNEAILTAQAAVLQYKQFFRA